MGIGVTEMVILLAVVVLIFGAGKLPRVAGDVAKGIKVFKSNLKNDEDGVVATPGSREPVETHRA